MNICDFCASEHQVEIRWTSQKFMNVPKVHERACRKNPMNVPKVHERAIIYVDVNIKWEIR